MAVNIEAQHEVERLALFGGRPTFARPVCVGRPNVGDRARFVRRVHEVLDRRQLTNDGPLVREFERRVAEHLGVRNCIATANATVALELAMRATSLTGEVIVPSLTFVATAHAARWVGLKPVLCDVDPQTGNIDPDHAERLITPATSAIVGVHLWGRPCATERLERLAAAHNLTLLFDAAHAFGCSHGGRSVGTFGDAEVFSFHATKVVNTFEGGAVVTDNDVLASRLRRMRNFGMSADRQVVDLGTNAKLNEVAAAMGLTSLESFGRVVERNAENYDEYRRRLAGVAHLHVMELDRSERNNFSYVVVQVDPAAGIDRDLVLALLRAENVLAQAYFSPGLHQMPPYGGAPARLPVTERLAARVIALPTGPSTSLAQVAAISELLRYSVLHGPAITRRARGAGIAR